jgi:tetratricopeptide (TPR) repeat protein
MPPPVRPGLPTHLLDHLGPAGDAVLDKDGVVAARAALTLVESLPAMTSALHERSAWLGYVRSLLVELGDACPEDVEVRLLASISRTALAAHETSAGLAAADHALARAEETGELAAQVSILAGRLPYVAHRSPLDANRDLRKMDAAWSLLSEDIHLDDSLQLLYAEVLLARAAYHGSCGQIDKLRQEITELGRLNLPRCEALSFVATASFALLGQYYLRAGQHAAAVDPLSRAVQLCEQSGAWTEAANLQTTLAATALLQGQFDQALVHARAAVVDAQRSGASHAQPDPWLGLPLDVCPVRSAAEAVHAAAEAVLTAQDLADPAGFLLSSAAMVAFYLADDRALEALDALTEATEVAKSLEDPSIPAALRGISERLLGHLGVLKV